MRKKKQLERNKGTSKTDAYGFPDPGGIVKQYREKLTYSDSENGKIRSWTQADLAKRLGVSEVMVRLMENQNKGLDSIERRRVLADLLKIPPVLLGLDTLPAMLETQTNTPEETSIITHTSKPVGVGSETVKLYQDAFTAYDEIHTSSTAHKSISDIENWICRIRYDIPNARNSQKSELYRILWSFHALSAKIYSDDLSDWTRSFAHLNQAFELASFLQDADLQAISLYRSSQVRFAQGTFALAKVDLEGAMLHARHAGPTTKGAVFASTGLAYALTATDMAGKTDAQRLFDQAEQQISPTNVDSTNIKYGMAKYLTQRSDALITMGRASKALELLEDAQDVTDATQTRRLAYNNILRAEAYLKIRQPEYDTAVLFLTEALEASKRINSQYNIGYIKRLATLLDKSSHSTSPQVADLRLALRDWYRPR